jgi:protein-S-isoprenylcysteine O-methyltransferase Ste14
MKTGTLLALIFLLFIALMHVLRLFLQIPVVAGGVTIPVWCSAFGVLIPGTIAWLLWRDNRR